MRTPRIPAAVSITMLGLLSACGAGAARSEQVPTAAAAAPLSASSATSAPISPSDAKGTTICDAPGLGGYDLLSYAVDKTGKTIVLTATFQPIEPGHDVVVNFTTPSSTKQVTGEQFENGSGVAQVQDVSSLETEYLDGPQDFAADHVSLNVPRQAIDSRLIHGQLTVELSVDGASVESCAPRS